ncbi:MAG: ABC transporter permease [Armatimonadota bacterium]
MDVSRNPAHNRLQWSLSFPVLMKEMRSRMRGIRAPILLFITTGLTVLVGLLIIGTQWSSFAGESYGGYNNMADIGKSLFIGLVILEGILCSLIAPALTAGAISIEREQQTLELLLLTRLSCTNIVLGKLLSSLGFLVVMLLCSLPVWAISFLLGGVDPGQLFWSLALIFVSVTLFGAIALYCSTRFAKTATAVAVAYCFCVLWLSVIPMFLGLFMSIYGYNSTYTDLAMSNWQDIPFVVFAGGSSAVLALIPATILSILIGLVFRHSLSRASNMVLWAGITVISLVALVSYPETIGSWIQSSNGLLVMIGNPVVATAAVIEPSIFSGSSTASLERYFIPITAGITLLCALLVVAQSVQELKRLRNGPPDSRAKRRPRKQPVPPAPVA